jgi:hypothetical protein
MMRRPIAFCFAVAASATMTANAETLFVSDKLVIGVYTEANQDSEKLSNLESGDAIEVLEKAEGYVRARISDGREGWIKSSYLTAQTPAAVRVKELERERNKPTGAPPQMVEQLKQLQQQNAALNAELAALKQPAPAMHPVSISDSTPILVKARLNDAPFWTDALKWAAGAAVLSGLIGYALGYRVISNRIRRKYGSLRIF